MGFSFFGKLRTEVVRSIVEAVQEAISPLMRAGLDSVLGQEAVLVLWFSNRLRVGSRLLGSRRLGDDLVIDFRHL